MLRLYWKLINYQQYNLTDEPALLMPAMHEVATSIDALRNGLFRKLSEPFVEATVLLPIWQQEGVPSATYARSDVHMFPATIMHSWLGAIRLSDSRVVLSPFALIVTPDPSQIFPF